MATYSTENIFVKPELVNRREHVIRDLDNLTKGQLLDLRDRQKALLQNKYRLSHLPDKGKRVTELYTRIVGKLKEKDEIETAALKFSELNLSSRGNEFVKNVEWAGVASKSQALDSDDEIEVENDLNPLKIIAQGQDRVKIVHHEKEKTLITEADRREIESFHKDPPPSEIEEYALGLCHRAEKSVSVDKFKPYQTTKTNIHDPEKEIVRNSKAVEVTAATPPTLRHPGTKCLSLQESLELQISKDKELKAIQLREAEAKLMEKMSRSRARDFVATNVHEFFKTYRVVNEMSSDEDDEEEESDDAWDSGDEVLDPDAETEKGGVTFRVQE